MRDDQDPGTLEMPPPRRRGRPPANGVAARTAAEHSQAYRMRRRSAANHWDTAREHVTDMVLIDRIRMCVTEGHVELLHWYTRQLQERYPII